MLKGTDVGLKRRFLFQAGRKAGCGEGRREVVLIARSIVMYSCIKTFPSERVRVPPPRIVVVPDIHADLEKARQCLLLAGVMDDDNNWIAEPPETVVVQLGDQVDGRQRAPLPRGVARPVHICGNSLKVDLEVLHFFNDLHRKAEEKGGAVYGLIGNHELMNVHGNYNYVDDDNCPNCRLMRTEVFSQGASGSRLLACTRAAILWIGGFVFVHAGLVVQHIQRTGGDVMRLNDMVFRFLMGASVSTEEASLMFGDDSPFSTRVYSPFAPNETEALMVSKRLDIDCMFVGHNAHPKGVTSIQNGKVFVFDPGLSRAINDSPASVIDIVRAGDGKWILIRV